MASLFLVVYASAISSLDSISFSCDFAATCAGVSVNNHAVQVNNYMRLTANSGGQGGSIELERPAFDSVSEVTISMKMYVGSSGGCMLKSRTL